MPAHPDSPAPHPGGAGDAPPFLVAAPGPGARGRPCPALTLGGGSLPYVSGWVGALTEQKPRLRRSPLRVQSMWGLSWPLQELLQTSRPSTRTSASISPGGGSSKSDTKPQPATRQRAPAAGGLAPLRGRCSSPTAGPRTAEPLSCGERPTQGSAHGAPTWDRRAPRRPSGAAAGALGLRPPDSISPACASFLLLALCGSPVPSGSTINMDQADGSPACLASCQGRFAEAPPGALLGPPFLHREASSLRSKGEARAPPRHPARTRTRTQQLPVAHRGPRGLHRAGRRLGLRGCHPQRQTVAQTLGWDSLPLVLQALHGRLLACLSFPICRGAKRT